MNYMTTPPVTIIHFARPDSINTGDTQMDAHHETVAPSARD